MMLKDCGPCPYDDIGEPTPSREDPKHPAMGTCTEEQEET
jgi:hypothetical protein